MAGTYELTDAITLFQNTLGLCQASGLNKVLVDYREVGRLSGTESTLYALSMEKQYFRYKQSGGFEIYFAYLKDKMTLYEPGANLLERSSIPFQLFDEIDKAMEWLNNKSDS